MAFLVPVFVTYLMVLPVGAAHSADVSSARLPAADAGATGLPGLGANHPVIAPQNREGKLNIDSTQKFTHFRVGNKNVKSMFSDGSLVWVGTSGGGSPLRYQGR